MKISFILMLCAVLALSGCELQQVDNPAENINIKDLVVPENFNFSTVRDCELKVVLKDNTGQPLKMIRLDVAIDVDGSKKALQSVASDRNGKISVNLQIPYYADSIYLTTGYLGLTPEIKIPINNNKAAYNYNANPNVKSASTAFSNPVEIIYGTTVIRSLSGFDALGVPDNLESTNDAIDGFMLNDVNASLPERMPVPRYNPEYLSLNNETDIVLNEAADVWVTFVHEGAGNKNILGFYTYQKDHPPLVKTDIDTIHVIFPNASYLNSGGGLVSGNKLKIGTFPANTVIGWACIADGFRSNTISAGSFIFFSDPELNPETDPLLRQHNVMLYDPSRQKVLLGFEDLKRGISSDDDFNDIVFYVTSNPLTAIDNDNYPKVENTDKDTDGDDIADNFDDYPEDGSKAFDNYYPATGSFATLAFEDLWPGKGDYDMNDITIDYQFNQVTNSDNAIQGILGKVVLKAMGCSFHNGFGITWPVSPSVVSMARGNMLTNGIIDIAANGLENNPEESVFIVFDDGFKVLPYAGDLGIGVNTNPDAPYVEPDTLNFSIDFTSPQSAQAIGNPPYNPFIFINQARGREVHLPDMPPTSRVDPSFFRTMKDDSDPLRERYYKTAENLPWALNVAGGFTQVTEKTEITKAYLHFSKWAQSGGSVSVNWYLDLAGNRDPEYIYSWE